MALLAWVVGPAIAPSLDLHPGIVHWILMTLGMIWQCIVSIVILRRELGTWNWEQWRQRLWLNPPRDPRTGAYRSRLYWWVIPALLASGIVAAVIGPIVDAPVTAWFPFLAMPASMDISGLADPQFIGQWWLLGLALVSILFNYLLGEELLFRGVLLPNMRGVFGRWDWVVNAVLFGLYHLHKPWAIPSIILSSLAISWPASRFRSNWMAVIVHGAESILVLILVLGVILGLAGN